MEQVFGNDRVHRLADEFGTGTHLKLLGAEVSRGTLSAADEEKSIRYLIAVRDGKYRTREKLNAIKILERMKARSVRVAEVVTKLEHAEAQVRLRAELDTASSREMMERKAAIDAQQAQRQQIEVAVTVQASETERVQAAVRVLSGLGLQLPADLVPGPATHDRPLPQ